MLRAAFLGGASFSTQGDILRCDLGPTGHLLACYLFEFMGRPHRREMLAELFWGEGSPESSRLALNTALWRIRKLLDRVQKGAARQLVTIGADVLLHPADFIEVDTHLLEKASRKANGEWGKAELTRGDEAEIETTVQMYHGPFLDGHEESWILQERERLHCLFTRTTLALMRAAARRGEYECALERGRRVLAVDPWRETVQQDVMLLLVLNGQRAEAIRAYHLLESLLKSDLGIEPAPDTSRLYKDILSGGIFDHLDVSDRFSHP